MATVNIFDMVDTWANGATTFTAIKMDVTDTASSASSLLMDLQIGSSSAFNVSKAGSLKLGVNSTGTNVAGTNVIIAGSQGTGTGAGGSIIFQVAPAGTTPTAQNALADALTIASNRSITLAAGSATLKRGANANYLIYENSGADVFQVTAGEINLVGNALLTWGNTNNTFTGYTADTILRRDAANTLALRNSTNAQTFRVYNTTDGTNSEFFGITWSSNSCTISTAKAGTGLNRNLLIRSSGQINLTPDATLYFGGGSNPQWQVGSSGHLFSYADNTYDIGASGANRPRDLFVGGGMTTGAPTGGTAAKWKLGTVATVSPTSPNRTIEVDIGGTIYYIHAKTTND